MYYTQSATYEQRKLVFDASLSSALYGSSETVQPAGLYGLLLIRAY